MDVVADSKAVTRLRTALSLVENALEVVLGDLDVGELVVVIGIEVEVGDDVAKSLEHVLASIVARRIGWAHVGRVFSENVADGHFVFDHLVVALRVADDAEVLMGPGVAGYLMAFGDHTLDHIGPLGGGIDRALANVDTSNKKGGLEAVLGELIQNTVGVDIWTVIVCDSDSAGDTASVDATSSVCDVALLWARVVAGACSSRSLVRIATRSVVDQTVRSHTVVFRRATIACTGAAVAGTTRCSTKVGTATTILTTLTSLQQSALGRRCVTKYTRGGWHLAIQVSR